MMQKKKLISWLLTSFLVLLLGLNVWCGINIHNLSRQRALIKSDYSVVNSLHYGLLSVNVWRDSIKEIVAARIQDFSLTNQQDEVLRSQISKVLNAMITQADSLIQQHQHTVRGKMTKLAVNAFVDWDEVRKNVPEFTQSIIDEMKKPANKDKLRTLAEQKLNDFAAATQDSLWDQSRLDSLLSKYRATTIDDFNKKTEALSDSLQNRTYQFTYAILGTIALFLFLWWIVFRLDELRKPLFVLSVGLALVVLLIGLTSPMIEIDARIKKLDFLLLGEHLQFHDQVIFFQSKSILDVVRILLKTKKIDSVFVGILILAFSVLFPLSKLISTELYLLGTEKIKKSKWIDFFAFKSGKWSMADVTVVAIFMAYVGFKGIMDNQLKYLDFQTENLTSITTNLTSLQPGFLLFLAFVIYSLVLSEVLKRIPKE